MSLNSSTVEPDRPALFVCPADPIHAVNTYERYKSHVNRCKALKNKKVYFCRFYWAHQYLNQQHKNDHEIICEYNATPGKELDPAINDFFIIRNEESIDERMVVGKYKSDQIDWWEKHKHEVWAIKRRRAALKRRNEQERLEIERPKKELEEIQQEITKKLDEINSSTNAEACHFQFRGPDFERFEMVLLQKGLFKFKVSWFDFEDYANLEKFDGFINESLTEQTYKIYLGGEFFLSENTQNAELNLSILLKNLSNGNTVAVNYSKGIEENTQEVLILVSKDTNHIGRFLAKISHLAVLVLSRSVIQRNTVIIDNEDLFKEESCWLRLDESERDVLVEEKEKGENNYLSKFVKQVGGSDEENRNFFEKIMRKHVLQNEQRKLEKALKEKENSYDKFIFEKRMDIQASEKQVEELRLRKEKIEGEIRLLTEKITKIQNGKDLFVKEARDKFKAELDLEKTLLNRQFNEFKRQKDLENQSLILNYQDQEMNFRELVEEHQRLDEKMEEIHQKKKQISEEIEAQALLNRQLEEKLGRLESEFEEKNFFAKIREKSMKSNKETVCLLCSAHRREIVNLPCKHITICAKCQSRIVNPLAFKGCLICNQRVTRTVKVIFENFDIHSNVKK